MASPLMASQSPTARRVCCWLSGDGAVGHGRDVEEVGAVLGDGVDEFADDALRGGNGHAVGIAPMAADGVIDPPGAGANASGGAGADFFEVDDGANGLDVVAVGGVGGFFGGDGDLFFPFGGTVVVVGGDPELEGIEFADVDPVVEPEDIGLVLIDEFFVALDPIDEEALEVFGLAAVGDVVEVGPFRIPEVELFFFELGGDGGIGFDEFVGFDAVVGDAELEALFAEGGVCGLR